MNIDRSLIAALPKFLTWTAGIDLLQTACKIYVLWSYDRLRTWSEFADKNLFDVVRALPTQNQQRLLLAPRSFNLLLSSSEPGPEEVGALKKLIGHGAAFVPSGLRISAQRLVGARRLLPAIGHGDRRPIG